MAGSTGLRQSWQRGTLWVSALVVAGLVLAVIIIVATSDHNNGDGSPSADPSSTPTASGSDTQQALPSGYVRLPRPTSTTAGFPTGYPHTPEGAAAYAAAYDRSVTSLDYATASSAYKAYVRGGSSQYAAAGVAAYRQTVKLSPNGTPPKGSRVTLTVLGVKWTEKVDRVDVAVDFKTDFKVPPRTTATGTAAHTVPVVWRDGRWWVAGGIAKTTNVAYAAPGTAGYAQAGWNAIQNDDWMEK